MKRIILALLLAFSTIVEAQTTVTTTAAANPTPSMDAATGTLSPANGGTGVANAATKTITLGGPLVTSGAYTTTLTATGTTGVTLPTSGTLATTSGTLPIGGGTLTGNLLFTDATYDIGASGATRPRDFYLSRNAVIGGTIASAAIDSTGAMTVRGNLAAYGASKGMFTFSGGQANIFAFGADDSTAGTVAIASYSSAAGIAVTAASFNNTGVILNNAITLTNVTTGTNADFLCMTAGKVVTLQTSACTISSARFKRDIEPIKRGAVAKVAALVPVAFNMKEMERPNADPNFANRQFGLTAENVAAVDKRMAIYEDDGVTPKSYRQEAVIALLVKAVQEQQEQINALRKQVGQRSTVTRARFVH